MKASPTATSLIAFVGIFMILSVGLRPFAAVITEMSMESRQVVLTLIHVATWIAVGGFLYRKRNAIALKLAGPDLTGAGMVQQRSLLSALLVALGVFYLVDSVPALSMLLGEFMLDASSGGYKDPFLWMVVCEFLFACAILITVPAYYFLLDDTNAEAN